jgi:hypothetical protein
MGSAFSTGLIPNDQLNKTAAIRTWNIIKNYINNGNLNLRVLIDKNDYEGIKDRLLYIKEYINDNYLNGGSGLFIDKCHTEQRHDYIHYLYVYIKECNTAPQENENTEK